MTPEQREELKAAALAVDDPETRGWEARSRYILRAHPAAILSLIAQVEALTRKEKALQGLADLRYAEVLELTAQLSEALTVPPGYRIVPIEPTPEMFEAAGESLWGYTREKANEWAKLDKFESQADRGVAAYAAMLDAAPTIPAIPGTKEGA